jgi:hypothetical protein
VSTVAKKSPGTARTPQKRQAPVLRCHAYTRKGIAIAECVDLDLIVQAPTQDQAIEKLNDAMTGYLKVACEGDYTGLIPRPSPLSRRLLHHWFLFLAQFSKKRDFRLFDCSPSNCLV